MYHIHITCLWSVFFSYVEALRMRCATTDMGTSVSVLDCGHCGKQDAGYVVLIWGDCCDDEVPSSFLDDLQADPTILDFCVYAVGELPGDFMVLDSSTVSH